VGIGHKGPWPNVGGNFLEGTEASQKAAVTANFLTKYLLNLSLKRHRYTKLICHSYRIQRSYTAT